MLGSLMDLDNAQADKVGKGNILKLTFAGYICYVRALQSWAGNGKCE